MVLAIVVTLLVVWIAVGAAVALLIGRAAHIGDVREADERFLRDLAEERRAPLAVGRR